jgi:signal transduction histidine kinase
MKPGFVWSVFGACLAVALLATAWSSSVVLRVERAERSARASAELEENARLALWRLDSALMPLLAQESARPYFQYRAYYPPGGAYGRMPGEAAGGDDLVPSPLLRDRPPRVLLHFQLGPGGGVTSPQVPPGDLRARALREGQTTEARLAESRERLGAVRVTVRGVSLWKEVAQQDATRARSESAAASRAAVESMPLQRRKSTLEYEARQQTVQQSNRALALDRAEARRPVDRPGVVEEGVLAPLWVGDALLLARQVRVDGTAYVQGCWLDWAGLRAELVASIADLLPGARLERAEGGASGEDERRLAALPVRLVPGGLHAPPPPRLSVARVSLLGAWAGLVVAATAVAILLQGVMALSERRRLFVSAVTHELRTPLTTFRLYTDMMAEGMVVGEGKRRDYLERLRAEAERLGHLVENVLFYARLESGRVGAARETVDLGAFVRDLMGRLEDRVRRAGLSLSVDGGGDPVHVRIDRSALEQILVNLVDNACKYAPSSSPSTIEVRVERDPTRARIRVTDHGPGLSARDRRAAANAPGVGLGLALSRRLARAQGGDLRLGDGGSASGATFVVSLPLAAAHPASG